MIMGNCMSDTRIRRYGGYAVYDTLDPNIDDEYEVVKPLWITGEKDQSYYGSGAVTIKDMVVIGGDGGIVSVRNAKTGEELQSASYQER